MHQGPWQSRWFPLLVALLAADIVLGLIFGALVLTRPDRRPAGGAALPTPGPALAIDGTVAPAPTVEAQPSVAPLPTPAVASATPSATPAPIVAAPTPVPGAGTVPPNPLVSRGKPAFAAPGVAAPGAVTDGRYCGQEVWRAATFPTWLAIQVGAGPSHLLLSWNGGEPDNYTGDDDAPGPGIPASYTIQTSADSTNGADGSWQTVATVRENAARTRAHSFPFAGASWVRMTVTQAADGGPLVIDEIDVHDTSQGSADTLFFMGDSITAAAFLRCDRLQPSYAELVAGALPGYFPAQIDGGVSGVSSDWGVERIDRWLADNPDYEVWAIAFGTNDAYRERPSEVFDQQLQTIIDQVKADGKEPVLARIPYTDNAAKDPHVRRLNGVIDDLTARNGLRPGPDLYSWFRDNPQELNDDGIHPTRAGSVSINRLWYEALRGRYGP